jgi:hypothetical protein
MQVLSCSCAGCLVAICGLLLRSQTLVSAARSPNFETFDPGLESSDVSEELFPIIMLLIVFLAAPSMLTIYLLMRANTEFQSLVLVLVEKLDKMKTFLSSLNMFHTQSTNLEENQGSQQAVTIEFSPDTSSKDDLPLEGVGIATFNHDETSRSVIQSKLISILEYEIQALKLENQKLRMRLNDHEVSPSSPTSDPVHSARRRMQTKPKAYLARELEADTITEVHFDGRFTPYLASLDPVDICTIDDDNHYRDSFSPQHSRTASHTAVLQHKLVSDNFQTSSRASHRAILKHPTAGSHVRDAAIQNDALAARMQNRVKLANVAASTEMGISSDSASSQSASSGSLQFKSRSRSLYDQA